MIETAVQIPNRTLFKPAEVCEIAHVQPYVLRSWESEFPDLGVSRSGGGNRLYRRADVERVLRIKHLLFVEGLTLAGIRRRIEDETIHVPEDVPIDELLGRHARERLAAIKQGLRSLLELLSGEGRGAPKAALHVMPTAASAHRSPGSNGKRAEGRKRHGAPPRIQKSARRRL